jgi:hypothetical protein
MPHLLAKLSGRNGVGSINHIFSDIGILTMSQILKKNYAAQQTHQNI